MTIYNRKHNSKLTPNAKNLRKNMTDEERKLWFCFLRDYPVKFIRQKIIGNYIADFYCSKAMLVIEIDGSQHFNDEHTITDAKRNAYMNNRNLKVLRFTNIDINSNFRGVCEYIDSVIRGIVQI